MTRPYICWTCGFDTVSEWDFKQHNCNALNTTTRPTISLAAITYELAEQRKLLEEILAMVKVKNNS